MTTVEEIKYKANIVDVIGRVVPLKKKGANHWGCCPFHHEKTPSFSVHEDKQMFHCFGCGESGDVITFVQKYYNLDFREAVERLANEYNIDISAMGFGDDKKKAQLYDLNREAAAFFFKNLRAKPNPGVAYMQKRSISPETMQKFGIGYADDSWQALTEHFKGMNADLDALTSISVLAKSGKTDPDGNPRYYDYFRGRVIFPIINTRGKVIGFGGRVLTDEKPKYLNTNENAIYQKRDNLYGLNLTRTDIAKEDLAIVVEGYMDVISLYQAGVRNVVASCGTALTDNQAALLKRYTHNVVLCYDADEAGLKAALRGMDVLHKQGLNVKVFHVTDGKDPDEFIKEKGKDAYLELVRQALPFADYKIDLLRKSIDLNTTEGNIKFLKKSAEVLRQLSPVEADVYIRKVASYYHISEGALRREVESGSKEEPGGGDAFSESGNIQAPQTKNAKAEQNSNVAIQKILIRLTLERSAYVPMIEPYRDAFEDPVYCRIFARIRELYRPDEEIDVNALCDGLEPNEQDAFHELEHIQLAGKDQVIFKDCMGTLENGKREKRRNEIMDLLSVLDEEENKEEIAKLTQELMALQKKRL